MQHCGWGYPVLLLGVLFVCAAVYRTECAQLHVLHCCACGHVLLRALLACGTV